MSDHLLRLLSAWSPLPRIKLKAPGTPGIWTREVYNLVAGIDGIRMITPPNPAHLPIAMFIFEHASREYEVQLQSLNGMQGTNPLFNYDTSVYTILALSRWRIPDVMLEELNAFNAQYFNCRATKVGEFVEVGMVLHLFFLAGHERQIIEDMIRYLIFESDKFVQDVTSS